jgi:NAD dependent epimerase/dehydratase
MNLKGARVLVTGAGGFIGSHLTEELVKQGAQVRALVRYTSRGTFGWLDDSSVLDSVEIVQGDIRDFDTVSRICDGRDVVFHLGAQICIPYSYIAPQETTAINVTGTQNVLDAVRSRGVSKMIHTSTSEVYGTAQFVPITEKHPLVGQSPYSASKIAADQLVESYVRSFNMDVTTVRPFNTFGPRQSSRAIIPTIAVQVLSGAKQIKLGKISPTRDFTFVTDTVAGMMAAASSEKTRGKTINLGTGSEITIEALAKLIFETVGAQVEIVTDEQRMRPDASEVDRLLSDNSQAKSLMGWSPKVSFKTGLAETLTWFKSNLGEYKRAQSRYVV